MLWVSLLETLGKGMFLETLPNNRPNKQTARLARVMILVWSVMLLNKVKLSSSLLRRFDNICIVIRLPKDMVLGLILMSTVYLCHPRSR